MAGLSEFLDWRLDPGGVGILLLCRPPVNALSWQVKRELRSRLTAVAADPQVRSMAIASGLPRAFSAGSDLKELASEPDRPGVALERIAFEAELWRELAELPQPTIAAVDGYALGGGLEMALACDFRLAGATASLGFPEVKIGAAPGDASILRLAQLIGLARARRMLLLGEPLAAEEALSARLVDVVVPAGEALAAAVELARRLAALPPAALQFLKASLRAALSPHPESMPATDVQALFDSSDFRQGVAAFLAR